MLGRRVRIIDHCPPSLRGSVFPTPYRFEIEITDYNRCYVCLDLTEKEFHGLRQRGVEDSISLGNNLNHSNRYLFVRIPKWSVGLLNKQLSQWEELKKDNFKIYKEI